VWMLFIMRRAEPAGYVGRGDMRAWERWVMGWTDIFDGLWVVLTLGMVEPPHLGYRWVCRCNRKARRREEDNGQ